MANPLSNIAFSPQSVINSSLEIIELLYEVNKLDMKEIRRLELIRKTMAKLKTIDFLTSIAKDASCFTTLQHDVILEKNGVCSKYLQGYYSSCKKSLKPLK